MPNLKRTTISFLLLATIVTTSFGMFAPQQAEAAKVSDFVCTGTIMNKVAGWALGKIKDKLKDKAGDLLGGVTGGGEVPVDDAESRKQLQAANKYQDIIDCSQETLTNLNHDYVKSYVNKILNNYTVTNYLKYAQSVAYNVYVADQLLNADKETEAVLRRRIQESMDKNAPKFDFTEVYKRRSLAAVDFDALKTVTDVGDAAYNSITDPFISTPQGQEFVLDQEAEEVYGQAQTAAAMNIENSNGKKDAFDCKADKTTGKTLCAVKYPGQYVTSQVDNMITNLFGEQIKPQRNVAAITTFITNFAKLKSRQLADDLLKYGK